MSLEALCAQLIKLREQWLTDSADLARWAAELGEDDAVMQATLATTAKALASVAEQLQDVIDDYWPPEEAQDDG